MAFLIYQNLLTVDCYFELKYVAILFRMYTINSSCFNCADIGHVKPLHTSAGAEKYTNKSVFNDDVDLKVLVEKSNTATVVIDVAQGKIARIVDAGHNIGIDRDTGKQTSIYTVIADKNDNFKTMHPGLPKEYKK